MLLNLLKSKCKEKNVEILEHRLCVSIPLQRLFYYKNDELIEEFLISSSRNPSSCIKNSLGTPDGLFYVCEKIGANEESGVVFKARISTKKHFSEILKGQIDENLITSRILRLDGLEIGHNKGGNCDTFERFVYIHGTNQENRLGMPNSHGCILMANADIIRLFDCLPETLPAAILFISKE